MVQQNDEVVVLLLASDATREAEAILAAGGSTRSLEVIEALARIAVERGVRLVFVRVEGGREVRLSPERVLEYLEMELEMRPLFDAEACDAAS